jgi:tetratricopeptide (TPR) repeat protein
VLAVLCLDERDDAVAWYTDRLRARHGARIPRKCPALDAVAREAAQAGNDKAATLAAVHRHEQELLACSTGALFVGELARGEHDLRRAEAAFRRAIALDAQGDALLFSDGLYAAHDGLALAVAMQGRAAESLPLFEQSLAVAKATGDRKLIGSAEFNLACAYAELGRPADASAALQRAVAIDSKYKQTARGDESIRKVLGAPELEWLSQ